MNDDTKFILRQMVALEGRIMHKLDDLFAFKNRALGVITAVSFVGGGLGAIIMEYIAKHF